MDFAVAHHARHHRQKVVKALRRFHLFRQPFLRVFRLRPQNRPLFVGCAAALKTALVPTLRQAAVRRVVVFRHALLCKRHKIMPLRQQAAAQPRHVFQRGRGFQGNFQTALAPRRLVHRIARLRVHLCADIGRQPLRRLNPHRLVQPLNHAARAAGIGQAVRHVYAQPPHQPRSRIGHHLVFISLAVIHVKNQRDTVFTHTVHHRREHRPRAFRQVRAPTHNPPRSNVHNRGDFRPKRLAAVRMFDLRVKRMPVRTPNLARQQIAKLAPLKRQQILDFAAAQASAFALHPACFRQPAARLMHAGQIRHPARRRFRAQKQPEGSLHRRRAGHTVKLHKPPEPLRRAPRRLRQFRQQRRRHAVPRRVRCRRARRKPAFHRAAAGQIRPTAALIVRQPQHLRQMRPRRVFGGGQQRGNRRLLAALGLRHQLFHLVQHRQPCPRAVALRLRAAVQQRGGIGIGQRGRRDGHRRQRRGLRQHLFLLLPHNRGLNLRRRQVFAFFAALAAAPRHFAELPTARTYALNHACFACR